MCLKIESRWKEIIQSKNYNIIQVAMNRNKDLILIEINQTLINTDQQITCLYIYKIMEYKKDSIKSKTKKLKFYNRIIMLSYLETF